MDYVGNINEVFHMYTDERLKLVDVSYVPAFGFNLYSFHALKRTHLIISDTLGINIIGTYVMFLRDSGASYVRATRLPAGTIRVKTRTVKMKTNTIF